jgi:hypothetical protein
MKTGMSKVSLLAGMQVKGLDPDRGGASPLHRLRQVLGKVFYMRKRPPLQALRRLPRHFSESSPQAVDRSGACALSTSPERSGG